MICDLVGSTALSARLDPEDMSELLRAYQACCAGTIARWDGYVARYLGDGVLALEFHAKMNALGGDQIQMMHAGVKEAAANFAALVCARSGVIW